MPAVCPINRIYMLLYFIPLFITHHRWFKSRLVTSCTRQRLRWLISDRLHVNKLGLCACIHARFMFSRLAAPSLLCAIMQSVCMCVCVFVFWTKWMRSTMAGMLTPFMQSTHLSVGFETFEWCYFPHQSLLFVPRKLRTSLTHTHTHAHTHMHTVMK